VCVIVVSGPDLPLMLPTSQSIGKKADKVATGGLCQICTVCVTVHAEMTFCRIVCQCMKLNYLCTICVINSDMLLQ